jgi:hypothetical protein
MSSSKDKKSSKIDVAERDRLGLEAPNASISRGIRRASQARIALQERSTGTEDPIHGRDGLMIGVWNRTKG